MKTYTLRFYIILLFILSLILPLGSLFFLIKIAISRPEDLINIGFILFSILILIYISPPIILTITYFREDLNKKVTIDESNGFIKIIKNNEQYIFSKKDLIQLYHVKVDLSKRSRYNFFMYEHLLFVFKEREKLIITNLLCKPDNIINSLKLNPKMIHRNIPLIDRRLGNSFLTTMEIENKVKEFHIRFKNKTDTELTQICKQKGYAEYAKRAAKQLLNERK